MRFPLNHSIPSTFQWVCPNRFAGLMEKVAFEQRPEGVEGVTRVDIRERAFSSTLIQLSVAPLVSVPLGSVSPTCCWLNSSIV